MAARAQSRRCGAADVDRVGGGHLESRPGELSRRKRHRDFSDRATRIIWKPGGKSVQAGPAAKHHAEKSEGLQTCWQTHEAIGHTGQDERQSSLRNRCECAWDARGGRGAPSGVWGEVEKLQCRE